ncbi:MAG: AAA family ATPase [Alphaproteobacteria bacterium]|nr:AAA family ATPase [Alphaproteobacteria bacterium]
MLDNPWMIVVCGPNGAGKSTFYRDILSEDPFVKNAEFINLDNEAAEMAEKSGKSVDEVMNEAGRKIIRRIDEKLENRQTFIYETTSSGRAHLNIMKKAKEHNFDIATVFIGLSSADLSVFRVKQRFMNGGHDVPIETIERRFPKIMNNFPDVLKVSDLSLAFDNSMESPFELIFIMDEKNLLIFQDYPQWLESALKGRKTSKEIIHISKEDIDFSNKENISILTERIFGVLAKQNSK